MIRSVADAGSRAVEIGVHILAFVRKDIADFVRQPRLVLALVLGPFLIMLLFGLGFIAEPPPLRTAIVVGKENPLRPYVEENADQLIKQLVLEGIIESESLARSRLESGEIDLAILVPENAGEAIRSSEHPEFVILHRAIDPIEINYIQAFTDMLVNIANRRALSAAVRHGQDEAEAIEPDLRNMKENAAAVRLALERGDPQQAEEELSRLRDNLGLVQAALGPAYWLALGQGEVAGASGRPGPDPEVQDLLEGIRNDLEALNGTDSGSITRAEALERSVALEQQMGQLQVAIDWFHQTESHVLVSPFAGKMRGIGGDKVRASDYYVPGTIALLLQHLGVTLGALSIVNERRTGTMELFQASPLAAIEVVAGKYLAYWTAGSAVAGVLTGLLVVAMGVPMLGSWWHYGATVGTLVFTSLGLGFLISLAARSTGQAVQYAMIALLASVFFSGFFLQLDRLRHAIRMISWALPVSYGIRLLQDVMLRGIPYESWRILVLLGIGTMLFLVAWLALRRELART